MEYVDSVAADRVAQIHIAGHSKFEKYTLDTHDHPVLDPVWRMYARAIERVGPDRDGTPRVGRQYPLLRRR